MLVGEATVELSRPEIEIVGKCESSTLACESLCESARFWIRSTSRDSAPTQNHRLLDRHCAIQICNQLSVRELREKRKRRPSTAFDLSQGLITDPDERGDLQVRPFLAGPDNVASLGDHHEAIDSLLGQLRTLSGGSGTGRRQSE